MFVLRILEKTKETRLKFSQLSVTVSRMMTNYQEASVSKAKLSKAQISKIIQSGGSFGSWLGNLENKALTYITIFL